MTLESLLFEKDEPFSLKTSLQIGIELLTSMEYIHNSGYTYNDLKLDNIMVGDAQDLANSKDSMHKIRLIDYGLCKKYVDHNGEHLKQQNEKKF